MSRFVSRFAAGFLSSLVLLTAIAVPCAAQTSPAPAPMVATSHDAAMQQPAGKFIQNLGDAAIGAIADKTSTVEQRNQKFRDLLRNDFDLLTIGRFVIGRAWNSATPEQQQEYIHLFADLVIKTYGDRLSLYTGEGFVVTGVRPESEKDTIVNSGITHPDGSAPTAIDWRVRNRDSKLGVIDVVVEGVSLSVTQRQEYTSIVQRDGGKLDGLLDQMRAEVNGTAPPPAAAGVH